VERGVIVGKCPTCGRKQTRTTEQNKKLHALCNDISKQRQWAGAWMDVEDWKRLFVAQLYGQKVVPSLDGKGFVVLNKRTGRMIIEECSEAIEYIQAWAVDQGIKLGDETTPT
jgi:hypothetical protein